jgi:hypothetical protein
VFACGKISDGLVELRFHSWDVDRFGERTAIPYHVKLSIEGLPHHARSPEVADKVLCDEAFIHHVDQSTRRREDLMFFMCWAFCHNPSRIPWLVYLTLSDRHGDPRVEANLHFSRPHNVNRGHTFRVLIHIDSVKDLMLYHHPPEQLMTYGKVQLHEFKWRLGRADGELEEGDFRTAERYCRADHFPGRRPRDDKEDEDKG